MVAVESKTQALYELTGVVSRVYTRETPAVFDVITTEGTFRCRCPFFKPVEDGDKITGIVSQDASGSYFNYMREPYVKVSFDANSIKRCFLKALRYQHWGSAAAEYLYDRLVASCRLYKLLRVMPKLGETPIPADETKPPADDSEVSDEITSYDVAAYLADAAVKWKQSKDSNIVKAITAGTTLDNHHIELLLTWWHKERNLRKLYLLGLTNKEIVDCHKPLELIYEICVGKTDADTGNPFRLPAIPMEKCYSIMRMQGVEPNAVQVACGNIVRKIYEYNQVNAWTCTPLWLLQRIYSTLHIYRETLEREYEIHFDCVSAYLDYPYKVETQVAAYLDVLIKSTAKTLNAKDELPQVEAETFKFAHCKTLDEDQKRAIVGAIEHDICIITGPPGSGKSTIIGEIVRRLELLEIGFSAGSFTGKAVARLQDILGNRSAKTLDRLISQARIIVPFKHLIIDEISMVTSELFFRLINAFKFKFKITLVGDEDQLGPISWGNLFSQLLIAGRIPTYRLTHNHRLIPHAITAGDHCQPSADVAPGELEFDRIILENSMALVSKTRNLGEPLVFRDGIGFSQVEGGIPIVETMVNMLARAGIPSSDITVISPFNEYLAPINAIFERVYLSESKRMMDLRKEIWCVGNRVMMLANNYDINVMNGEEGLVIDVNDVGVVCKFKDGAEHTFKYAEPEGTSRRKRYNQMPTDPSTGEDVDGKDLTTEHITKSFAITVHKAQGSEQQFVIVYIPLRVNAHGKGSKFLNINLLYTAMTRTKRALWLVGSQIAIAQATCQGPSRRYDNLASRLKVSRDEKLEAKLAELCKAPVELTTALDCGDEFPDEEGGGCYLAASYFGM